MITLPQVAEIQRAALVLHGVAVRTGLVPLHEFAGPAGVLLKPEIHQPIGSFKIRGVFHAVAALDPRRRAAGLSTVSAGNTAQALAWAGRHFGVPARSRMPSGAPAAKIEALRRYGGEPVLVPVDELFAFLRERRWEREPYAFIHPWIERDVIVGHATIGLEIVADLPGVAEVWVPVGGGGLAAGIGSALRALAPDARLIAVEPEGCPALHESFRLGRPATVGCRTICDGVAVPYITDELYPVLRQVVDEVVLVPDDAVVETIRALAGANHMVVEPSGALSVAAVRARGARHPGRTVCIVTGGSIDPHRLAGILGGAA